MKNSNPLNLPSGGSNAEPLYQGDFFGAPGEYWTEIDWSRVRSDFLYCKAVIDRFETTAYLHKCTIKNVDQFHSKKTVSAAQKDLPFVRDCISKLTVILEEIDSSVQDQKVEL